MNMDVLFGFLYLPLCCDLMLALEADICMLVFGGYLLDADFTQSQSL
jgi:hypothetical protein